VRFEVIQRYDADAEAVTAAYADPDLYPTLVGLPKLGRIEVLGHDASPGRVKLRIRFAFTGDLPSAVTAVVDPHRLTWVQETDHDLATGTTTFRLVPDHYPDRLTASGTFVVAPTGSGCTRTVQGELKVHVLLVGGKAEGGIVGGLREYLTAEAPAVDAYLRG
jgi:hypothetical protein